MNFKPTASLNDMKERAKIIAQIRSFFNAKGYLEIETPILSKYAVTDVNLDSFETNYDGKSNQEEYFLTTSPEFHMKRLLASGFPSIFQITKAFRNGEIGRLHNPEFTILEWYKQDASHFDLMDEIDELISMVIGFTNSHRITYSEIFKKVLAIDPLNISIDKLQQLSFSFGYTTVTENRDELLDFLLIDKIEPWIKENHQSLFIYNYPATQAALAKADNDDPTYANRFELYIEGVEIANGFNELTDILEQQNRFSNDNDIRKKSGKPIRKSDELYLEALASGLPACSGVAVGLDRLIMQALSKTSINEVICFPFERA